jgi:hypothetical protein
VREQSKPEASMASRQMLRKINTAFGQWGFKSERTETSKTRLPSRRRCRRYFLLMTAMTQGIRSFSDMNHAARGLSKRPMSLSLEPLGQRIGH